MKNVKQVIGHGALFLLIVSGLVACDRGPWTEIDTWYRKPPSDLRWTSREDIRMLEVVAEQAPAAVSALEGKPLVAIDAVYAANLTGRANSPPVPEASYKPYLVRAVHIHDGSFAAFASDSKLLIANDSRPGPRAPMQRKPLVIWLNFEPSEVFVTCAGAS